MRATMTLPTLTIGDDVFDMDLMRVKETYIGFEDHNIFAWGLSFEFNNVTDGTGLYALDSVDNIHDFFKQLMNTVGVRSLKAIDGKLVYALRDRESKRVVGIANVLTPTERFVRFSDFYAGAREDIEQEGEDEAA